MRAVVDDDDLEMRIGLRQRTLNGLAHKPAAVETRDDDGDKRRANRVEGLVPLPFRADGRNRHASLIRQHCIHLKRERRHSGSGRLRFEPRV